MRHGFGFACRRVESLCVAAMACALPGRRSDAVGALRRAQYLVLRAVAAKRGLHFLVSYWPLASLQHSILDLIEASPTPLLDRFIWKRTKLTTLAVQHNAHCCAAPLHSLHCAAVLHCKRWRNSPRASTSSYTNRAKSKSRNASAPPAPQIKVNASVQTTAATARPRKGGRGCFI